MDEFEQFRQLAERIKVAKLEDAETLARQVEATTIWKDANKKLTELNEEMRNLTTTMINNATATEIDKKEEKKK